MATTVPTELIQSLALIDLATAQGSKDFLQKLNDIIRALKDLDRRVTLLGG